MSYDVVPNSLSTYNTESTQISGNFNCRELLLSNSRQFVVQPNDIVGACLVPDTTNIDDNVIYIAGERMNDNTSVYQDTSGAECNIGSPISIGSFTPVPTITVHVRAVISKYFEL